MDGEGDNNLAVNESSVEEPKLPEVSNGCGDNPDNHESSHIPREEDRQVEEKEVKDVAKDEKALAESYTDKSVVYLEFLKISVEVEKCRLLLGLKQKEFLNDPEAVLILEELSLLDLQQAEEPENRRVAVENDEKYIEQVFCEFKVDPFNPDEIIGIKELKEQPNVRLTGKFLICKSISIPRIKDDLQMITVLEDPHGEDAVLFETLTGGDLSDQIRDLLLLIPESSVLVISDPLYTKKENDQRYSVVVTDLTDIQFIPDSLFKSLHPEINWISSVKDPPREQDIAEAKRWQHFGCTFFIEKNYLFALNCFNIAIKLDPHDMDTIAHRSATFLPMGIYSASLSDSEKILEKDATNTKAINRKVKALWGMGEYDEALEFLKKFVSLPSLEQSHGKLVMKIYQMTKDQLLQQNTGEYDLMMFYKNPYKRFEGQAEYFGPLEAKETPGGMRYFASEKIKAGQLIMATRSFISVTPEDNLAANWSSKINHLTAYAIQRMKFDKNEGKNLYLLTAGQPYKPLSVSEAEGLECDLVRLANTCELNAFGTDYNLSVGCDPEQILKGTFGVWIKATLLRHDCLNANCTWRACGDFLFIRALKDISPGEELVTVFTDALNPYYIRKAVLHRHGFTCGCELCKLEDQESTQVHDKRVELQLEMQFLFAEREINCRSTVAKLIELTEAVEALRPNNLKLNFQLLNPLQSIGVAFALQKKYKKAVEYYKKAYKIAEAIPTLIGSLTNISMNLVVVYINSGQLEKAKKWAKRLKEYILINYGCIEAAELISTDSVKLMRENGITLK